MTTKSLTSYFYTHRTKVGFGALLVISSVVIGVLLPFVLRFAIDDLTHKTLTRERLFLYAGLIVGGSFLSGTLALWMRRVVLSLGYAVESEIRKVLFVHLTCLDRSFYQRQRTGDIMTKMTSDLQSVREFVGQGLLQGFRTVAGFILAFAVMFAINAKLAAVMLLLLPAISILFFFLLRLIRKHYTDVQEQYSIISNHIQESFSGIRLIKGFSLEARLENTFKGHNQELIRRNMALSMIERPIWPLMMFLFGIGVIILLTVGGRQVIQGQMTLGELVQFQQYLLFLQWPMLALGWTTNLLQRGMTSWERIRNILDTVPDVRDGAWTDSSLRTVRGDITYHDVSLRFEGRTVLSHINLAIPEGATVGVTGPTGSGKTQLVSLIARLMDPTLGVVQIGGRSVREYPLDVLREHIGMAPQEPFLFSDTLANNIGFGLTQQVEEQILWAAQIAQLRSDVDLFPSGFETLLGERGITLSGGQRQRTAISRAIARQPQILILDDVFSAIDTQTEARIFTELRSLLAGRTSIIISHRVSTLRDADIIVVLEQGKITQKGTHQELTQVPGYYRELDETQRLEARLEAG